MGRLLFLLSIKPHPVLQSHCHQPGVAVAPVEEDGHAVMKAVSVPDGLSHSLAHIQPFHTLDLDMYPRQPHKVGNFPEGQRSAPLDGVAILGQEGGKLPLAVGSLTLG